MSPQRKAQNEEITIWFDLVSSLRPKPMESKQILLGLSRWDDGEAFKLTDLISN